MGNLSMHGYAIYGTHALFCFVLFFNLACEQDNHIHDEEHTDADGFVLEDESGVQIYSELEGNIEGSITITPGDTLELSVHFLDHEGNEIEHDEKEDEDELSVNSKDIKEESLRPRRCCICGLPNDDDADIRDEYYSTKHGKMAASYYGFLDNYLLNPKTAVQGHGDGHFRFRYRVHVRGNDGNAQVD